MTPLKRSPVFEVVGSVSRAWLPSLAAVLGMATDHLPDPAVGALSRVVAAGCCLAVKCRTLGFTAVEGGAVR